MSQRQATVSGLPFCNIFVLSENFSFEVSDDVITCDLWFEPPPIKNLGYTYECLCPSMIRFSCISLFNTRAKSGSFCVKKIYFWFTSLSKILVARLVAFTAVDKIFQATIGHRRNQLRNAVGLILKLLIIVIVQDLNISFY